MLESWTTSPTNGSILYIEGLWASKVFIRTNNRAPCPAVEVVRRISSPRTPVTDLEAQVPRIKWRTSAVATWPPSEHHGFIRLTTLASG